MLGESSYDYRKAPKKEKEKAHKERKKEKEQPLFRAQGIKFVRKDKDR